MKINKTQLVRKFLMMSCLLMQYNLFAQHQDDSKKLPVDITYLAIDLKFDHGDVQILEFQDGPEAGLRAYDYVFGKGGVWKAFWQEIFALDLPVWYVGPQPHLPARGVFSHHDSKHLAFDKFLEYGGSWAENLSVLSQSRDFRKDMQPQHVRLQKKVPTNAIVLHKYEDAGSKDMRRFVKDYPNALVVNRYMRNFSYNKEKTNELFSFKVGKHIFEGKVTKIKKLS